LRILAIETSGAVDSVAALLDDHVLSQITLASAQRTARSLAPGMRDVLRLAGWQPRDVELVAVSAGPGSFTGLRLGVTTAKTFAYAAGAEVLGVNTLEVIAAQAPLDCFPLELAIDAQRGQFFAGSFARNQQGETTWDSTVRILDADAWLRELPRGIWVSGPVLGRIADRLPAHVRRVDAALWQPTAASVGLLAFGRYRAGERQDVFQLVPLYVRRSAAEEKAETNDREKAAVQE
jgi:tRNA threonylcarbamoyladenosine biosynthesis protein TsaB